MNPAAVGVEKKPDPTDRLSPSSGLVVLTELYAMTAPIVASALAEKLKVIDDPSVPSAVRRKHDINAVDPLFWLDVSVQPVADTVGAGLEKKNPLVPVVTTYARSWSFATTPAGILITSDETLLAAAVCAMPRRVGIKTPFSRELP